VRYGNFFQFVRPTTWGHVSLCFEPGADPVAGEFTVHIYDQMHRRFRNKGWMVTKAVIQSGITCGVALEVGPGNLGLEWLRHADGTRLTGLDISADMIAVARRNTAEYGLGGRTE
jgi:ubiquinone/menaquinone biosynthesis C-methylase UbiE